MVLGVVVELQNVADAGLDVVGGEGETALADVDADGLCAGNSGEGGNGKRCEEHVGGCFVLFGVDVLVLKENEEERTVESLAIGVSLE